MSLPHASSPYVQLTAQLQHLKASGSLSNEQAQVLLSLARQLQLGAADRVSLAEDQISTIAVAHTGSRRRREVRWDASAAPRQRLPTNHASAARMGVPLEDADDTDTASHAAQAPSEYAHGASTEAGDRDEDLDEDGIDFDTAELYAGGVRAALHGGSDLKAEPQGNDSAASDRPGSTRYALPGEDMDAAGKRPVPFWLRVL